MVLERQAPAKFYFARNMLLCTPNGRKNAGRHDTHCRRGVDDARQIARQPAVGDDAMHVRMMVQVLAPRVQQHQHSE